MFISVVEPLGKILCVLLLLFLHLYFVFVLFLCIFLLAIKSREVAE